MAVFQYLHICLILLRLLIHLRHLTHLYVLCVLFIFVYNRFFAKEKSITQRFGEPTVCTSILACTGVDNVLERNLLCATVSRALPNRRLARAFGIENAFTTMNKTYLNKFRAQAANKLTAHEGQWRDTVRLAKQILCEKIQVSDEGQTRIHLVTLIQLLSLKISLYVLFQQEPPALDDKAASSLAWTINALWILSKDPNPNKEQMKFHQDNLSKDLNSLLPNHSLTGPCMTPMDFIIPAYETLWRVVLQAFIEVVFRHPSWAATWRSVLAEFIAHPTAAQFSRRLPESPEAITPISAEDLAKEALRLYPPTKRVYRTFQYPTYPELVTVAADIEHLHRNPTLWGRDSTTYVPGRWASNTEGVSNKYFPFGARPMVCPAERFGPKMIAVLLAVLTDEFGAGTWTLEGDKAGEAEMKKWKKNPSQPLDSSRKAHSSLYLCRNTDS